MKRFFAISIFSVASFAASADNWQEYTTGFYILPSAESPKISAAASIKKGNIAISLIDLTGMYCRKGSDYGPESAGALRVNGNMVKFTVACIGGMRVLRPETEKGKKYFESEITSKPTAVFVNSMQELSFNSEDFESIKKSLIDSESAL